MRRKKREVLIPFEKSRRIIHLDKRGRGRRHMSIPVWACLILGVLCILYCLCIALSVGFGTRFFFVWGAMGAAFLALGYVLGNDDWMEAIPGWMKITACCAAGGCILIFLIVQGLILSRFGAQPSPGADYCIVLGAQMKGNGPSEVLRRRLDAALEYLMENQDTLVIVSGGQGTNEPVSEAQGMYDYLTAAGIAPERILLEDKSENTYANLRNSSEMLDKQQNSVVVVTNNFHMYRAMGIAQKMGYTQVDGLSADSVLGILPNNLLREFFGVIKDMLVGNL